MNDRQGRVVVHGDVGEGHLVAAGQDEREAVGDGEEEADLGAGDGREAGLRGAGALEDLHVRSAGEEADVGLDLRVREVPVRRAREARGTGATSWGPPTA